MKKLLFIAGEPGSGKSTRITEPLRAHGSALVLETDSISKNAAKHYAPGGNLGSRWQLWKLEFDSAHDRDSLRPAYLKAVDESHGCQISHATQIVVEGVLAGHPEFRRIMDETLRSLGFEAEESAAFAVTPSWEQVQRNLRQRGRPEDKNMDFICGRSSDYQRRLALQADVQQFADADECCQAAQEFLASST